MDSNKIVELFNLKKSLLAHLKKEKLKAIEREEKVNNVNDIDKHRNKAINLTEKNVVSIAEEILRTNTLFLLSASNIEIDLIINALNYEGKLLEYNIYLKIVEDASIGDAKFLEDFDKYILLHNMFVDEIRSKTNFLDNKSFIDFVLQILEDNKFILESVNEIILNDFKLIKNLDIYRNEIEKDYSKVLKNDILDYSDSFAKYSTIKEIESFIHFLMNINGKKIYDKHLLTYKKIAYYEEDIYNKLLGYNRLIEIRKEINENEQLLKAKNNKPILKSVKKEVIEIKKTEEIKKEYVKKEKEIVEPCYESKMIFQNIIKGNNISVINPLLPKENHPKYHTIKQDLICLLIEEMYTVKNIFDSSKEIDEGLIDYLNLLNKSYKYLEEYFKTNLVLENIPEKFDDFNSRELYFAKKSNNSSYILSDIKSLDLEYQKMAIKLLKIAKSGKNYINLEKSVKISGSKKFWELKYDQLR